MMTIPMMTASIADQFHLNLLKMCLNHTMPFKSAMILSIMSGIYIKNLTLAPVEAIIVTMTLVVTFFRNLGLEISKLKDLFLVHGQPLQLDLQNQATPGDPLFLY